jgi:hypothetical protein
MADKPNFAEQFVDDGIKEVHSFVDDIMEATGEYFAKIFGSSSSQSSSSRGTSRSNHGSSREGTWHGGHCHCDD